MIDICADAIARVPTFDALRQQSIVVRFVVTHVRDVRQMGDAVREHELVAGRIRPLTAAALQCPGHLPPAHLSQLLGSRERTQRFTGVKLARLVADASHEEVIARIAADDEEDVYIRLEAASYLASVCNAEAAGLFKPSLSTQIHRYGLKP